MWRNTYGLQFSVMGRTKDVFVDALRKSEPQMEIRRRVARERRRMLEHICYILRKASPNE
ncbi:hypothetical protein WN51_00911 [Melipona quadrifasciata]|uniref:Uncharacterized protein n=1 Tax=Melipona quadrifasciata TaxID=166423 RepID=A0A0M8ZVM2_9HYME|nr:hypothetical protein WN51_00911 [Melipona quadrifasciata]